MVDDNASFVPTGSTTGVPATISVEEAQAKAKAASEAKKEADAAEREAAIALLPDAQQKAREARLAAEKADAEAHEAGLALLQARANAVLERKLGRKLREGEYARWISGDKNNLRMENLELCSGEILALEKKTGRHINAEELDGLEQAFEKGRGK